MCANPEHGIVPHGGFTDPEYGCVGLTEEQARAEQDIAVAIVPYSDLDRAVIDGRSEGFCKLIAARRSRKVLGAHIVGEQATEIAQLVAAGMAADVRVGQLVDLEFAYPTFTAIVGLAARRLMDQMRRRVTASSWRELTRPHLDRIGSRRLKNISSLAFGGPDLRTVYLGCLLGEAVALFRSPVPGRPPVHWEYDA